MPAVMSQMRSSSCHLDIINGPQFRQARTNSSITAGDFHQTNTGSDAQELQKSAIFDIRKDKMDFLFRGTPKFVDQVSKGAPVNFAVVILPQNVMADNFVNLRQAKQLGAKVITAGSYY